MDGDIGFDPISLGLDTHYTPEQRQLIRRMMLEDWQVMAVKLPTYMKLVARSIAGTGVPEEWLSKLIHQTADKMLKGTSTPRYEFWACLHLYIRRKYGDNGISSQTPTDDMLLGEALAQFGATPDQAEPLDGIVTVDGDENKAISFQPKAGYARITQLIRIINEGPFAEDRWVVSHGVAISQGQRLFGIVRAVKDRSLASTTLERSQLTEVMSDDHKQRLTREIVSV